MGKESALVDRNFDGLAERFAKNIYGGLKGDIRLKVLERDFRQRVPLAPFVSEHNQQGLADIEQYTFDKSIEYWKVLDAGGGQAQFGLLLAEAGHQLTVCDISEDMLNLGRAAAAQKSLRYPVQFEHTSIQDWVVQLPEDQKYDLVLCHAVMEWVVDSKNLLENICMAVGPNGYLSLTFYNIHSLVYKNLLRTNFKKIRDQDYVGSKGSLTPINPQSPEQVFGWLQEFGMQIELTSGIRVFHDYIFDTEKREAKPDELIEMELLHSQQEPYWRMGRYIHVIAKKIQAV